MDLNGHDELVLIDEIKVELMKRFKKIDDDILSYLTSKKLLKFDIVKAKIAYKTILNLLFYCFKKMP